MENSKLTEFLRDSSRLSPFPMELTTTKSVVVRLVPKGKRKEPDADLTFGDARVLGEGQLARDLSIEGVLEHLDDGLGHAGGHSVGRPPQLAAHLGCTVDESTARDQVPVWLRWQRSN